MGSSSGAVGGTSRGLSVSESSSSSREGLNGSFNIGWCIHQQKRRAMVVTGQRTNVECYTYISVRSEQTGRDAQYAPCIVRGLTAKSLNQSTPQ